RTSMILAEVNRVLRRDFEVVHEIGEDSAIGSGPGENRLLVVADREDVAVVAGQSAYDAILGGIQVLKLVDENGAPSCRNCRSDRRIFDELSSFDQEHV